MRKISQTYAPLQAAQDNHFMHSAVSSGSATGGNTSVTLQALKEFAGLHHELTEVSKAPSVPLLNLPACRSRHAGVLTSQDASSKEKVASWETWLLGMPENTSQQEESTQAKRLKAHLWISGCVHSS